jgi:molybdopterin-containing oxidoreductase family iron-sulfur binding subunit
MPPLNSTFDRRDFLKLAGISIAALSLESCRNRLPLSTIVPLAHTPKDRVLGQAQSFATSFPMPDFAQGVLATSYEGRPTKLEGNAHHSASLGSTSAFAQASILDLYDPYRLEQVRLRRQTSSLFELKREMQKWAAKFRNQSGQGLALLFERSNSPSLHAELTELEKMMPKALIGFWDPIHRDQFYEGTKLAFAQYLDVVYDFSRAESVISIDFDFLGSEPNSVRHARDYYSNSSDLAGKRLYVFETSLSLTGAKADHHWPVDFTEVDLIVNELEKIILGSPSAPAIPSRFNSIAKIIAAEVEGHRGRSLILIGSHHSSQLQARVHRLNVHLQNIGKTVHYSDSPDTRQCRMADSLKQVAEGCEHGLVDTLIIVGGNPVFSGPRDFDLENRFKKARTRVHFTRSENETTAICDWAVPLHHYLESWSDVALADGSVSLLQPLIAPLVQSLSPLELLNTLKNRPEKSDYDTVLDHWRKNLASDFEEKWRKGVELGVLIPSPQNKTLAPNLQNIISIEHSSRPDIKTWLALRPDPTIWDGQFGENAWLQELPKPFTNLTWDNALLVSPLLANELNLRDQDVVEVKTEGSRAISIPILVVKGLPDKTVTLHLGYGRTESSPVCRGVGVNAYPLRSSRDPSFVPITSITRTGKTATLARATPSDLEVRNDIYKELVVGRSDLKHIAAKEPDLDIGRGLPTEAEAPDLKSEYYQWGMAIDLASCIGCSACVVACQAENNIPVVGREQVLNGRIMHWIRIDRYPRSQTQISAPQPITCMHCEKAPCEVVCPVQATNHSSEGLNQMVYNRCVGTRYCSNNCPYKVRRFNFYKFADDQHETLKMQRNPEVSVRSRGVMEKCTYCVQRIQNVRIDCEKQNREIVDGEIRTACEAVCPTQAIVFGNILDSKSRVYQLRESARSYGLLTNLGIRPRTTYLQALRNPNRELEGPS